jgi:outer membrane protein assembly factor BamB
VRIRHAILPGLLVLLAGCSSTPVDTSSQPAELVKFKQSATLTVRWSRDIGDMGNSILQPALTPDAIYAADAEGELLRLKRDNGRQVWRVKTGFTITGGLGEGEGLVLAGGEKGEVAAYGEDGKLRWQTTVSSEVLGAPQVADGIVVVRSGDGRIAGLSAADGKRLWLYERIMPALVVRSNAGVVIRHGTIYAGYAGGKLVAISLASGNAIWEATLSEPSGNTELERISDITSLPRVDDQTVCAVSFQGRIGCFDAAQGTLLWSHDLSSEKGLAMQDKYLYVTDAQGEVLAVDKNSGSSVWKNDQLFMRGTSAPCVLGDFLVVGDYEGYLHALRRDDGSLAARIGTDDSAILSAPLEMDNGLLVQTYDGGLYSVALH